MCSNTPASGAHCPIHGRLVASTVAPRKKTAYVHCLGQNVETPGNEHQTPQCRPKESRAPPEDMMDAIYISHFCAPKEWGRLAFAIGGAVPPSF